MCSFLLKRKLIPIHLQEWKPLFYWIALHLRLYLLNQQVRWKLMFKVCNQDQGDAVKKSTIASRSEIPNLHYVSVIFLSIIETKSIFFSNLFAVTDNISEFLGTRFLEIYIQNFNIRNFNKNFKQSFHNQPTTASFTTLTFVSKNSTNSYSVLSKIINTHMATLPVRKIN